MTEEDWNNYKQNSMYSPQSIEDQGFIHCSTGEEIGETANRLFKGRDDVLLLIINSSIIDQEIKYELDEDLGKKFPHIYGPINIRCIIDKIKLAPEADGSFDISFKIEH
ncbi:MAG: DUF952 domain-containing protein [Balneolaceae bacterium]|nr:DUF952 domain-containing protein [Balneolaceae bacterium]